MKKPTINPSPLDFAIIIYYVVIFAQDFISRKMAWLYNMIDGGGYDTFTPYEIYFYVFIALFPAVAFVYMLPSMNRLKNYQYIFIFLGPPVAFYIFNY